MADLGPTIIHGSLTVCGDIYETGDGAADGSVNAAVQGLVLTTGGNGYVYLKDADGNIISSIRIYDWNAGTGTLTLY